MLKTITAALTLTVGAFAALPATAAPDSRVVRYDDLNLASPAGVERLERRIDQAARAICGFSSTRTGPGELAASRACLAKAKARAREQMASIDADQTYGG